MNKKEIKTIYPLLKIISKLGEEERRVLLRYLNHSGCNGIYECVHNGLCNSTLPEEDRKKLAQTLLKDKKNYRFLLNSSDPDKRQQKLVQVGGSLGAVLNTVLPLLTSYLANDKRKKKKNVDL